MQHRIKSKPLNWDILKLVRWATSYFKTHGVEGPRASAEILLAHALNLRRIDLYLRFDQPLHSEELKRFKALIRRRKDREPVAYIIGVREFWSRELAVTRDVLIPRPETENLVEAALKILAADPGCDAKRVLELGTGSGAVVIALAAEAAGHVYFASDICLPAAKIARANARRCDLLPKINIFCCDWMEGLNPARCAFDLILSNPPYIKRGELGRLQPEIFAYEPLMALDGGPDGLDCLRRIIAAAPRFLRPDGVLLLEIGDDQRKAVINIANGCGGYDRPECFQDYSGHDRVIQLKKKAG